MCGRFTLVAEPEGIGEYFDLPSTPELAPRYNIAPTQPVPVVLVDENNSARTLRFFRWGLIPSWAKNAGIGARMINARGETAAEKPAFRSAMKNRRCLIVADGFYEWRKLPRGKQPMYIRMKDGGPFAFAGLWERWQRPEEGAIETCTIITTIPNELLRPIHDRMPVILPREHYDVWLDPDRNQTEMLAPLLAPCDAGKMEAFAVSTHVNRPSNDDPKCIERI